MNTANLQVVIGQLEEMFTEFNNHWFSGKLERPVIAVSPDHGRRRGRTTYGWCTTYKAWQTGEDGGYYEINMCAEQLNRPFTDTAGTLLHEMVHLQNIQDGVKDCSRSGTYHNKEFKRTAEEHGLTVEKGKSGWHITKLTEQSLEWVTKTYGEESGFKLHREKQISIGSSGKSQSSRKYVCPSCGSIIRATKEVHVLCVDCGVEFAEQN
jgi:ribosomal protein L37AE/L43A